MEEKAFRIQGSEDEPYRVVVRRFDSGSLGIACNCRAGTVDTLCKHRVRLLLGSNEGIVHGSEHLQTIAEWFSGSELLRAVESMREIEKRIEADRKTLKTMKTSIAEVMAAEADTLQAIEAGELTAESFAPPGWLA